MHLDPLSATFSALAHPTRRAILAHLTTGMATVKELAAPFSLSAPAVSRHLRVLEQAGLIVRGRNAQWRPCRLDAAPLKEVVAWAEEYRRFWNGAEAAGGQEQLDPYLRYLREKDHPETPDA